MANYQKTAKDVSETLQGSGNPAIANHSKKFFKAVPGGYGEGDKFHGIRVPNIRKTARQFKEMPLHEIEKLIQSDYHEERLCGLIIMVNKVKKTDEARKKVFYDTYLTNTAYINNWDLVDTSAEYIIGAYLINKERTILYDLAKSSDLWERRIAIMSTFHFIKNNEFTDTLALAELLLNEEHDLIHKAVGWMLREVGKRNLEIETAFLDKYTKAMPRTMLRYAIEKFEENKRQHYLNL